MKELGRSTQKILTTKDRWSELLTYITDVVQPEETNRWKSINTHTHTHTHNSSILLSLKIKNIRNIWNGWFALRRCVVAILRWCIVTVRCYSCTSYLFMFKQEKTLVTIWEKNYFMKRGVNVSKKNMLQ